MISINDYRKHLAYREENRYPNFYTRRSNGGVFIPKLTSKHTLKLYYCIMNVLYKLEFHLRSHDD